MSNSNHDGQRTESPQVTLGHYLTNWLHTHQISNRTLARGAGVSESVIRNLLQHGIDPEAKNPDPHTLRGVADYLGIDPLKLFCLAGYLPTPSYRLSARTQHLVDVFDLLPVEKQDAVLHVLDVLIDACHLLQVQQ